MTLIDTIKRHEGFRAIPYQCSSGVWTIGYGFTSLTKYESDVILKIKVDNLQVDLAPVIEPLSPARQDVIINMAYNLGIGGVMGFKRMWLAIYDMDFGRAADEMLDSRWARQVGRRAGELSEIMRKGEE